MPEKKWVLITGAASGIGRSTALLLADKGFGVYATDLRLDELDDLHQTDGIKTFRLDITSDSDIGQACAFIDTKGTGLFALINNAGIFSPGPLMEPPIERLIQQYTVNVFGTHRITKALFPMLLGSKGRIVVFISNEYWRR